MDYTEIEQVVSDEWIIAKMQEFGLADNPRKIHLTKAMKGLFYYYFRTKDLENKII